MSKFNLSAIITTATLASAAMPSAAEDPKNTEDVGCCASGSASALAELPCDLEALWLPALPSKVSFSEFEGLTDVELATLQIKITYVGPQTRMIPSAGIILEGTSFDVRPFKCLEGGGMLSGNDVYTFAGYFNWSGTVGVRLKDLRQIMDELRTDTVLTDGFHEPKAMHSFSLSVQREGHIKVFEDLLNSDQSTRLFEALLRGLAENKEAHQHLYSYAGNWLD